MRCSRDVAPFPACGLLDLPLQRGPELRHLAVAFDPPPPRFHHQQRAGDPPVFLLRRAPVIHFVRELPQLRIEGFQTVGRFEAHAQHRKQPQTMEGERLLQAFVQAGHGGEIDPPQFVTHPAQGRSGFGLRRLLVGLLETPPPRGLLGHREIADDILTLMPLTPLDQGMGAEHHLYRGA